MNAALAEQQIEIPKTTNAAVVAEVVSFPSAGARDHQTISLKKRWQVLKAS